MKEKARSVVRQGKYSLVVMTRSGGQKADNEKEISSFRDVAASHFPRHGLCKKAPFSC